jgi:asparagine synthase (glutamine-hydrolysing)
VCGIAGGFNFSAGPELVDQTIVASLNGFQRHRGPDGEGLWASGDRRMVLGHRRLAIIETGQLGHQPMKDTSGRWVISFNGEIYNHKELRAELQSLGCTFATQSDTEVLINVVARWGEAGLSRLRGMYAFALWDNDEHELWLARDPYGIKPLYMSESNGTMWFASQARALAHCAPVNTGREAAALVGFYLWGHIPEPFSWWTGITMFPAGHVQRIKMDRPVADARSFDSVARTFAEGAGRPLDCSELRQLLLDAVRHHMVADVPVGIFLSAGIDSNVVAALATEITPHLSTITLAFDEYAGTADDEAPIAEAAARLLGSDHVTTRIGREEFVDLLDRFIQSMDQPTIDGLNTYLVSRCAAVQGLKVALSGLGGDELFGGYPSFKQIPRLLRWGKAVAPFRSFGSTAERILRLVSPNLMSPKVAGLLSHSGDIASAYLLRRTLFLEGELELLLDESWLKEGLAKLSSRRALMRTLSEKSNIHAQVAALESCWYMRNQLLRDTDWSSMAHGLEVRVPFVDFVLLKRLAPAIASPLPPTKQDLAACARLPKSVVSRPKTGFTTPVRKWIDISKPASQRWLRGWSAEVHRSWRKTNEEFVRSASGRC